MPQQLHILLVLNLAITATASAGDADEPAAAATPDEAAWFETHIRPLLATHCLECHSMKTGPDNGGLILETINGLAAGGDRGSILSHPDQGRNLLLHAVSYADPDLQMPPAGKLPERDLQLLTDWVHNGAKLPAHNSPSRRATEGVDYESGRRFWSFAPLSTVVDKLDSRPGEMIDALVDARLTEHQLVRNPPAERAVLLRRLTFDLTGLPPTLEELDAFAADTAPDAAERVVDRLLASPHYGERQARLWLDLARYADFTPDWQSPTDRGWLYRDWIVNAFNRDLPFDHFVRLQLAADLLPDTSPDDLAALGFLGLSPTYWKELRLAPPVIEQIVADEWDERLDTVSRTFLGLTVSCARCHDHKFDPISTEDYYALAGVFASTQLDERPLLPDAAALLVKDARVKAKALEERLKPLQEQKSPEADAIAAELHALRRDTPHFAAPFAHVVRDAAVFVLPDGDELTKLDIRDHTARDLPVFRRGNPANPGDVVPRRFLTVLSSHTPIRFTHGSGRAELAEALLSDAQGLTARVFVNRIWEQHFGSGLVRTPSDFGAQGELPSHPELLEFLAADFVAHGWDVKHLHRRIVLSETYRQSSAWRDDGAAIDPDNRLLWRTSRRSLDFEHWRDATLAVSGRLDLTTGGPSKPIDDPDNVRRTIYATIDREELHPIFRMHDVPEPSSHSPRREPTTTPLQQLFVLNSAWMNQQAQALAGRAVRDLNAPEPVEPLTTEQTERIIDRCYLLLFARMPDVQESAAALAFLRSAPPDSGLTLYCQALLGLNEFRFVD